LCRLLKKPLREGRPSGAPSVARKSQRVAAAGVIEPFEFRALQVARQGGGEVGADLADPARVAVELDPLAATQDRVAATREVAPLDHRAPGCGIQHQRIDGPAGAGLLHYLLPAHRDRLRAAKRPAGHAGRKVVDCVGREAARHLGDIRLVAAVVVTADDLLHVLCREHATLLDVRHEA